MLLFLGTYKQAYEFVLHHRNIAPVNYNPNRLKEAPIPQIPDQSAAASDSFDSNQSDTNVSIDENQFSVNDEQIGAPEFEVITVAGTPNAENIEIERDLIEQSTSFADAGSTDSLRNNSIDENDDGLPGHSALGDLATDESGIAIEMVQHEKSTQRITVEQLALNDGNVACSMSLIERKPDIVALRNVAASNLNEICDALDEEEELVEEIDGMVISYKSKTGFVKPFPTTGEFNLIKRQKDLMSGSKPFNENVS